MLKVKEDKGEEQRFLPRCRDDGIQHPVRTEACKELANFPLFILLVFLSKQARWHLSNNSSTSDKTIGTQVLVSVPGGLVELFAPGNMYFMSKLKKVKKSIGQILAINE